MTAEEYYKEDLMVKSINDNIEYIKSIHASLRKLTPEYMIDNHTIPLHPGAEKYYKEINLME